jgi:predicted metal-dependent phosphoesterase TrpH
MTELSMHITRPGSVDLHTHSNFSDGVHSPAELIAEAVRRGVRTLALTDHDTLDGLPEAKTASANAGLEFIPGVELSTEIGPHEVHILGYFVDPADSVLTGALASLATNREERAERMIERLSALGFPVAFERVREIAGPGTLGRPHIARAMIELGYVVNITEAFDRFLANGRPGFIPRERVLPEDAVRLVRRAGAVPVLAHPLTTGDIEATLQRLLPAGLLGLEAFYAEYPSTLQDRLADIARTWDLIPTGGSDYHGPAFKEGRDLGSAPVPYESVEQLRHTWESQQTTR